METIVTRMRDHALAGYPLLEDFRSSAAPGERLAAVTMLQVRPDRRHWHWLGERLGVEKPFIGYHAGVALLSAARLVDTQHLDEVKAAISVAQELLGRRHDPTDRSDILGLARRTLAKRQEPHVQTAVG